MTRISTGPAKRGSQKWLQKVVNEQPELLNAQLRNQFGFPETETITWYSPLEADEFAEYQDQAFLDRLGITLPELSLDKFWPSRGPCWDGLAKSKSGGIFLVEAKAHISEIVSPGTGASGQSLQKIQKSLDQTKTFLNSKSTHNWSSTFYQYTNRLAHLYLLRILNQLPAYLVFVNFVNDEEMNGPKSVDEWRGAIKLLHRYLGIGRNRLNKYITDVYLDVQLL